MGNKHQFVSLCSDVTREVFHHYLLFSWRSRSVASIEEGVLSEFGTWAESIHYLCSIILVRELPKCFYSWPCFKFKSIGLSSLGIQSFKIKLYLPLIIINLQFSPWLIFRNVHNEKLLKKTGREEMEICPLQRFSHLWPLCLKLYCSVVHFVTCLLCQFNDYWNKIFCLIQKKWCEQLVPISVWVIGTSLWEIKQLLVVLTGKEYS